MPLTRRDPSGRVEILAYEKFTESGGCRGAFIGAKSALIDVGVYSGVLYGQSYVSAFIEGLTDRSSPRAPYPGGGQFWAIANQLEWLSDELDKEFASCQAAVANDRFDRAVEYWERMASIEASGVALLQQFR